MWCRLFPAVSTRENGASREINTSETQNFYGAHVRE